jgi:etoposide-induced 2.4 mRNA
VGRRCEDCYKVPSVHLLSLYLSILHTIPWKPYSDREIRSNILKSLLLNSLSLTSIYAFDLLLQPLVHNHPNWLHRNVGWFYRVLWLFPVVGVSYYLNVSP